MDNGKAVIMVGTATCGRAAGAMEVLKTLRYEVKKRNLDCPIIEVGCMGHCYSERNVTITKPGYPPICYAHVNPAIAERLIKEFILGDEPIADYTCQSCGECVIACPSGALTLKDQHRTAKRTQREKEAL